MTTSEVSPLPAVVPTRAVGSSVTSAPMPATTSRTLPAMVMLPPSANTLLALVPSGTVMSWLVSTMLPTDVTAPPSVAALAGAANARIPKSTSAASSHRSAAAEVLELWRRLVMAAPPCPRVRRQTPAPARTWAGSPRPHVHRLPATPLPTPLPAPATDSAPGLVSPRPPQYGGVAPSLRTGGSHDRVHRPPPSSRARRACRDRPCRSPPPRLVRTARAGRRRAVDDARRRNAGGREGRRDRVRARRAPRRRPRRPAGCSRPSTARRPAAGDLPGFAGAVAVSPDGQNVAYLPENGAPRVWIGFGPLAPRTISLAGAGVKRAYSFCWIDAAGCWSPA